MEILTLFALIAATAAAASTGALFPPGEWYERLNKPRWAPPKWMFPTVWTVLYILIVWAANRVALSGHALTGAALAVFAAQIVLNAVWSPMFFGLRRLGLAFGFLCGLWLSVLLMIVVYFMVDWVAGTMMLPYLVWVTAAGALNLSVWRRNPEEMWKGTATA